MGYFFKVFLVLAVLSHYSYPAKKSEEAEGNCSSFVVSPQKGTAASIGLWTDPYSFCTGQTPFQRSCFLGQNPCCNPCGNDEEASFLEVLTLPCCDEGDVPQMLEVWNGMASMQRCLLRAAGIQAGLRPADRAAHAMDGNFLAIAKQRLKQSSHTKPEAQPTWTSTRRRATLSGPRIRQGTATDANASNGAYDDAVSTAYDATPTATTCGAGARAIYYDGQRDRQGHESSCGDAGGDDSSTSANASHRADLTDAWCSNVLGHQYAHDAFSSGPSSNSNPHASGRCGQGRESAEEFESPSERNEKRRGHFVPKSSVNGARNEETRREKQYARTPHSSTSSGVRKRRTSRSRKCKSTIAHAVEALLATICYQVEGIHYEFPSIRLCTPGQCSSSPSGSPQRCNGQGHHALGTKFRCSLLARPATRDLWVRSPGA